MPPLRGLTPARRFRVQMASRPMPGTEPGAIIVTDRARSKTCDPEKSYLLLKLLSNHPNPSHFTPSQHLTRTEKDDQL